jgi:hypothetical protein
MTVTLKGIITDLRAIAEHIRLDWHRQRERKLRRKYLHRLEELPLSNIEQVVLAILMTQSKKRQDHYEDKIFGLLTTDARELANKQRRLWEGAAKMSAQCLQGFENEYTSNHQITIHQEAAKQAICDCG